MTNDNNNKSKQAEEKTSNDDEFEEMEVDDDLSAEEQTEGEIIDNTNSSEVPHEGHGRRRRIKIKKRIRVKKKTNSKRKYKKVFERIIWITFIVGFVAAIIILIKQLGINDDKYKATKKRSMIMKSNNSNQIMLCDANKQFPPAFVNSI